MKRKEKRRNLLVFVVHAATVVVECMHAIDARREVAHSDDAYHVNNARDVCWHSIHETP